MLSVIIASHDRKDEIIKNLKFMKNQGVFNNLESILIVSFDGNKLNEIEKKEIIESNPCSNNPIIIDNEKHCGQNYARNIALEHSKKVNSSMVLFLDDDAYLTSNSELKYAIDEFKVLNKKGVGALGLNVIKAFNNEPQYYTSCKKKSSEFAVLFPCLAGTIISSEIVNNYEKFFFPEEIHYGADEWALACRVRSEGYQVYATTKCNVMHNIAGGGRSKDIRYKYQYAHSYIWATIMPLRVIIILVAVRLFSLIQTSKSAEEKKYFKQKISGLFNGLIDGIKEKKLTTKKYSIKIKDKRLFRIFIKESFSERNGIANKIVSKLI